MRLENKRLDEEFKISGFPSYVLCDLCEVLCVLCVKIFARPQSSELQQSR